MMLFYFNGTARANMAMPVFDYQVESRSDDARVKQGEQVILWTVLKNTGTNSDWYANSDYGTLHLGTSNPKDRTSQFYTPGNWLSANRVNEADTPMAAPGETMTFGWYVSVPAYTTPGVYQECFAPVIENWQWMREDGRLCWNIYVEPNNDLLNSYQAEVGWETANVTVQASPGGMAKVSFEAKNIGQSTWYRDGQYPLHLGTYDPPDRMSDFASDTWLTGNRAAMLDQEMVKPGETGSFSFDIQAPEWTNSGSTYQERFWLVAENLTWLKMRALDSATSWLTLTVEVIDDNAVSETFSTIFSDKEKIKADGKDKAKITVELKNDAEKPLADKAVKLVGKGCDIDKTKGCWDLNIPSQTTDADGRTVFNFTRNGEANFAIQYQVDGEDSFLWLELVADNTNGTEMCGNEDCLIKNLDTCTSAVYNEISLWPGSGYVLRQEVLTEKDDQDRCRMETEFIESDEPDFLGKSMRCAYENADEYPIYFDTDRCEGTLLDYLTNLFYGEEECNGENSLGDQCGGGLLYESGRVVTESGCDFDTYEPICEGADKVTKTWSDTFDTDEPADSMDQGANNTNNLWVTNPPANPAADYCHELVLNGFDDWYLPAIDELADLFDSPVFTNNVNENNFYWSSTEDLNWRANTHMYSTFRREKTAVASKSKNYLVRCIRKTD